MGQRVGHFIYLPVSKNLIFKYEGRTVWGTDGLLTEQLMDALILRVFRRSVIEIKNHSLILGVWNNADFAHCNFVIGQNLLENMFQPIYNEPDLCFLAKHLCLIVNRPCIVATIIPVVNM